MFTTQITCAIPIYTFSNVVVSMLLFVSILMPHCFTFFGAQTKASIVAITFTKYSEIKNKSEEKRYNMSLHTHVLEIRSLCEEVIILDQLPKEKW